MSFPIGAAVAAAHALDEAEVRGHAPQFARWRTGKHADVGYDLRLLSGCSVG